MFKEDTCPSEYSAYCNKITYDDGKECAKIYNFNSGETSNEYKVTYYI